MIDSNISIEKLVEKYSFATAYLSEKGIRCIRCGEPIWGTLEEACLMKNFTQEEIRNVVEDLNKMREKQENKD